MLSALEPNLATILQDECPADTGDVLRPITGRLALADSVCLEPIILCGITPAWLP